MISDDQRIALQADIDLRLIDTWTTITECHAVLGPILDDDDVRDSFATLLRVAYGRGYLDALAEDTEGNRGALCTAHGYTTP